MRCLVSSVVEIIAKTLGLVTSEAPPSGDGKGTAEEFRSPPHAAIKIYRAENACLLALTVDTSCAHTHPEKLGKTIIMSSNKILIKILTEAAQRDPKMPKLRYQSAENVRHFRAKRRRVLLAKNIPSHPRRTQ